ncbi:MAG: hypothetical protein C5B49_00785 [Bdellovibrio sp.]|nr:MAG: hypothetical protein C5B49_00785 [Bdellovibrio sp.]
MAAPPPTLEAPTWPLAAHAPVAQTLITDSHQGHGRTKVRRLCAKIPVEDLVVIDFRIFATGLILAPLS